MYIALLFMTIKQEDDKTKNNMVIDIYLFTICSKTRNDQELKSEGQGHKISIFENGE